MDFEIFTYGGGGFLQYVFNGIAALMGADDFQGALQTAMLIGLLVLMAQSAFKGSLINWPWFLAALFLYLALLVPKADVIVTDRVDPTQSAVVGNVPIGIAAPAGIVSLLGDWATRTWETLFAQPDDLQYHRNGMLFGNYLVDVAHRFEITDSRTQGNLSEMWRQCVFYDILLGKYEMDDLARAEDMWAFIQANTSPVRAFTYRDASGSSSVEVCKTAVSSGGVLDTDVSKALETAQQYYGRRLVRATDPSQAVAKFAGAMPVAMQWLTGLTTSAHDVIRQAALSNSMHRGYVNWAAATGSSAAVQDYALARAEAERRTTYAVMGEIAGRMLPIIRNLFEALIYAIFPLVAIMLMTPIASKVLVGYARALLWLAFWGPLYATLHSAMSFYAAWIAKPHALLPDGTAVYSLATYTGLSQVMSDTSILAGYLALSIPLFAWLLTSVSGAAVAGIAGRIAASYESPVSQGANEASTGNISLSNASLGNTSMWQQNAAASLRMGHGTETGADGVQQTYTADGTYINVPSSSLPMSINLQSSISERLSSTETSMVSAAQSQAAQLVQSQASTLNQLASFSSQVSKDTSFGTNFDVAATTSLNQSLDRVQQLQEQFRSGSQMTRDQSAELLGAASLAVQAPGVINLFSPVSGGAQVRVTGSSAAVDRETWDAAKAYVQSTNYGEALSAAQTAGERTIASYTGSVSDSRVDSLQSGLSETTQLSQSTTATMQTVDQFSQARERMTSASFVSTLTSNDAFKNFFVREHTISGSLDEATQIFRDANNGHHLAIERVQDAAADFAERQALTRAGIGSMPENDGVILQGRIALDNVRSTGATQVPDNHKANDGMLRGASTYREDVLLSAQQTRTGVELNQKIHDETVRAGMANTTPTAESIKSDITERTDASKQTLLADTFDGAGKLLPYQDKISDLKKYLPGEENNQPP